METVPTVGYPLATCRRHQQPVLRLLSHAAPPMSITCPGDLHDIRLLINILSMSETDLLASSVQQELLALRQ